MSLPYEILIRSKDGVLRGAAAYDTPGSAPRPLTSEELSLFGPDVNLASIARITELEAQLAAAQAGPGAPAPGDAALLSSLAAVFGELTSEHQVAYAADYAIVRTLIQAGRMDLAHAHVLAREVPADLEAVKSELLALLALLD